VSLNLAFTICVDPDYFQRDVQQALLQALGSGTLPNGQPALFARRTLNWDKLSTQSYLCAARAVAGVQTVTATVFEPQDRTPTFFCTRFYSDVRLQVAAHGQRSQLARPRTATANDERRKVRGRSL